MTLKKETITLKGASATGEDLTLTGYRFNEHLFINRNTFYNTNRKGGWSLTHVPTGRSFCYATTKKEMLKAADSVMASGVSLDFDMDGFNNMQQEQKQALGNSIRAWR